MTGQPAVSMHLMCCQCCVCDALRESMANDLWKLAGFLPLALLLLAQNVRMPASAACAGSNSTLPLGYRRRGLHHDLQSACRVGRACWLHFSQPISAPMPVGVESWSVINDQDAVARSGKLLGLFKRAGERIFLNQKGDMLVCPGFLEAALWRKLRSTNVRHHLLAAYLKVGVQRPFACYLVMTAGL